MRIKISQPINMIKKLVTKNVTSKPSTTSNVSFNRALNAVKPKRAGMLKVLTLAFVAGIPSSVGRIVTNTEKIALKNNDTERFIKQSIDTLTAKTSVHYNDTLANLKDTFKVVTKQVSQPKISENKPKVVLQQVDPVEIKASVPPKVAPIKLDTSKIEVQLPQKDSLTLDTSKIKADMPKVDSISCDTSTVKIKDALPCDSVAADTSKMQVPIQQADSVICDTSTVKIEAPSPKGDSLAIDTSKIQIPAQKVDSIEIKKAEAENFHIYFKNPSRQKSLEKIEEAVAKNFVEKGKIIDYKEVSGIHFKGDWHGTVSFKFLEMVQENYDKSGRIINPNMLSIRKEQIYKQIEFDVYNKDYNLENLVQKVGATKNEIPFVKLALSEIEKDYKASLIINKEYNVYNNQSDKK